MSNVNKAAVLPVVSAKTKEVFLKIVPHQAETKGDEIIHNILDHQLTNLGADLKAFAQANPDARVWTSKASTVSEDHLDKSQATQLEFWQRSGFTVVNLKHLVAEAKAKLTIQQASSTEGRRERQEQVAAPEGVPFVERRAPAEALA